MYGIYSVTYYLEVRFTEEILLKISFFSTNKGQIGCSNIIEHK